jgi:hypothetical protein
MSGLSDTLTVGLVLILLFGSACLYLYTRIQQAETKINLLESILLDLKMTNELKSYPPLPVPATTVTEDELNQIPVKPRSREASVGEGVVRPFSDEEGDANDLVAQIRYDMERRSVDNDDNDRAHDHDHELQNSPSLKPITLGDIPHKQEESLHVSPSYDSMTAKELQSLAKQRNISGTSGLRRAQLIELLKQADERSASHVDIMESIASSSLVESAEELPLNA